MQMPLHPGVKVPDPAPEGFLFESVKIKQFPYDARKLGELLPGVVKEMNALFRN
ncbi:MAG: hypothetical protein ACYTGX_17970 [Planctomycetota bacterium]